MSGAENPFPEFVLDWKMSAAEKFALVGLVRRLQPAVALEIGTHRGGSLQVLAAHCGVVHAIDIDPTVKERLSGRFPSAHFHIGPSREQIPAVLAEVEAGKEPLGFILVDGDHKAAAVREDIELLLRHRPRGPVHILLHDSFNPDCRAGMRQANWAGCPYVQSVNLDFIPGTFHATASEATFARSMWGGFALAVLDARQRSGALEIESPQEELHQIVYRQSAHRLWNKVARGVRRKLSP